MATINSRHFSARPCPSSVKVLHIAATTTTTTTTTADDDDAGGSSSSSRRRGRKKVTQRVSLPNESRETLNQHFPLRSPLNLVTIGGPARSGKSFFMNSLLAAGGSSETVATTKNDEGGSVFSVAGGSDPCTVGAFISTTTRTLSQIYSAAPQGATTRNTPTAAQQRSGRSSAPGVSQQQQQQQQPRVGFVDVEGQGDRDASYEMKLVVPLLLLSKVYIFNWKRLPNKETMLDSLACMAHAAELLGPGHRKNALGHLVILLRDVPVEEERDAYRVIFEEEDEGSPAAAVAHIKARNERRRLLKLAFQTTRVRCLPSPHPHINDGREIRQSEVSAEFAAKVGEIRAELATEMLVEPHRFGDRPIEGGAALTSLLTEVCAVVNQGSKGLVPLSMMESVHQKRAEEVFGESKKVFIDSTRLGVTRPQQPKAALKKVLDKARRAAVDHFAGNTQGLVRTAVDRGRRLLDAAISQRSGRCYAEQETLVTTVRGKVTLLSGLAQMRLDEQEDAIRPILWRMSERQLHTAWNDTCETLHGNLTREVARQVPAFAALGEDAPALITLGAFRGGSKGKLDGLIAEHRALTAARLEEERIERAIQEGREWTRKMEERRRRLQRRARQEREQMRQYMRGLDDTYDSDSSADTIDSDSSADTIDSLSDGNSREAPSSGPGWLPLVAVGVLILLAL